MRSASPPPSSLWVICSERRLWQDRMKFRESFIEALCNFAHIKSGFGFGRQLHRPWPPPRPYSQTLPQKCLFHWLLCCVAGDGRQAERHKGERLSGPANVSGLLQTRRCAGERWRNEGRRCLSRRCPTRSCWLLPEANMSMKETLKKKKWDWTEGAFILLRFLTSAHLWIVSGPTPPSTSMSNEGNWLLNQLTWVTCTEVKELKTCLTPFLQHDILTLAGPWNKTIIKPNL